MNCPRSPHLQIVVRLTHPEVECWNFQDRHISQLESFVPGARVEVCCDENSFLKALGEAKVAVVWRFRQEWLDCAPCLKMIATPAAGQDYFQLMLPPEIELVYGSFHGEIIGETVVGALLSMTRGILPAATTLAGSAWPRAQLSELLRPLRGSHVLILGFGTIGEWIGRLLKPFGVRLSGVRRHLSAPPDYFDDLDRILTVQSLDTVLPETDHLVLALPGTPETNHLINRERLALLPRFATLCNVGRGKAVDQRALEAALRAGRLAGAFLDVFDTEPLPADSSLHTCPNLWMLPHASAISPNYLDLYVKELSRHIVAALRQTE